MTPKPGPSKVTPRRT